MRPPELKLTGVPHGGPATVQTVAVTSGKGGVGKTTVSINLAVALAGSGLNTILLDADLGMANVDAVLGLSARANLLDVLQGRCGLGDILVEGPGGVAIVPAASGSRYLSGLGALECAGLVHAFSELEGRIDALIIDTATGLSESVDSFCRASSRVVVVTNTEAASIRDAVAQIRQLNAAAGIVHFHVLVNMVAGTAEGDGVFARILGMLANEHQLAVSYAGCVPADDCLRRAVAGRQAVVRAFPGSRSAIALRRLAQRITRWPRPSTPHGRIEFFLERLLQHNSVEREVQP